MRKLKPILFFLMLMSWIPVSGQRYVIGSDTLHCFTTEEVRKTHLLLEDLKDCEQSQIAAFEVEQYYDRWVKKLQSDSLDLAGIISAKDDLMLIKEDNISFLNKSLKREKRNHTITKLSSVGVLAVILAVFIIR